LSPPLPLPIIRSRNICLLSESEANELFIVCRHRRARDFVPVNSKIDMDPRTEMDMIGKSHIE
jgi:hypothetical protein